MKLLVSLLLIVCFSYASYTGYKSYELSNKENEYKYDYAELHMIKYGLFNLNFWKERLFEVLKDRVHDFEITTKDLEGIRTQIEFYLSDLYKEYFESGKLLDAIVESKKGDSKENALGKMFVDMFRENIEAEISKIDFKAQIPLLADKLMVELERKTPEIKKAIGQSISDMLAKEMQSQLTDRRQPIYEKYGCDNLKDTNDLIIQEQGLYSNQKLSLIRRTLLSLGLMLIILLAGNKFMDFKTQMTWLSIVCMGFLLLGLALPMIDLDARLSTLDISLMGANIHFDEQVMYYQSKSIIDVTITLLEGRGIDLKIVGLLILLFSIILPFSKMILSTVFLYIKSSRKSKLIQTIIFYMGKWSMADVFVVAIFMSYIGFYGLLSSMLGDFSRQSQSTTAETVNYSQLSPGIIFFTSYCLLSIVMSSLIHRKFKTKTT